MVNPSQEAKHRVPTCQRSWKENQLRLGLDSLEMFPSVVEPVVRLLLDGMTRKAVVSPNIGGMDLHPRTSITSQSGKVKSQGRGRRRTDLYLPLLAGGTIASELINGAVQFRSAAADLTYQALDMYFPLFIFFAGRSDGSGPAPATVTTSTTSLPSLPFLSTWGATAGASWALEVPCSPPSLSRASDGGIAVELD